MGWIRWAIAAVVTVSAVGLVVGAIVSGGRTADCAVAPVGPTESVVATVVAREGPAVTFETTDGRTLVVRYPGSTARFLHRGSSYHVDAWGTPGNLASELTPYCGVPGGTTHVDGTAINTGVWSHERLADELPWTGAAVALVAAAALGLVVRHRRRHPRLTIDGRPLGESNPESTDQLSGRSADQPSGRSSGVSPSR